MRVRRQDVVRDPVWQFMGAWIGLVALIVMVLFSLDSLLAEESGTHFLTTPVGMIFLGLCIVPPLLVFVGLLMPITAISDQLRARIAAFSSTTRSFFRSTWGRRIIAAFVLATLLALEYLRIQFPFGRVIIPTYLFQLFLLLLLFFQIARSSQIQARDGPSALFQDDFQSGLDAWWISGGWLPTVDERGLQLVPTYPGRMVLLEALPLLESGVIECEVFLEPGALFNVVLRGTVNPGNRNEDEFYMARLDARSTHWDCILVRPKAKTWRECNKGALKYHSCHNQWLKMHVVADRQRISLYRDGQLVDQIDNAQVFNGRIGLFSEERNVYVRRLRIFPLDAWLHIL